MILKSKSLNKKFYSKRVLKDIDLFVESNKIYGLLGPNGSGKTTFMRIAANLIKNTSGSLLINDLPVGKDTKKYVSFMPTDDFIPRWMKIKDAIDFYNSGYFDFNKDKCLKMLKKFNLEPSLKTKDLSTGMKQGLKICLTLSRDAKLFLLDEPFNGIDILAKDKIKEIILEKSNVTNAIIISSHLIDDLENLIDHGLFLKDGKIVLNKETKEFEKNQKNISDMYREVF
ncbi:MAG: ABC transporter ATP-binding protein [Bacillota bacterium]